jgi:hypothetical protein
MRQQEGLNMRIAYISCDDVNRFLFRLWARRAKLPWNCETAVHPGAPLGAADGVVIDLDYLPGQLRAAWLAHAIGGATARLLVHGHNISDLEAQALRRAGAVVVRGRFRRGALLVWIRDLRRVEAFAARRLGARDTVARPAASGLNSH